MSEDLKEQNLESLIEDFEPQRYQKRKDKFKGVTLWLAIEDKLKYDEIQKLSGQTFSKLLHKIFRVSIHKYHAKLESRGLTDGADIEGEIDTEMAKDQTA